MKRWDVNFLSEASIYVTVKASTEKEASELAWKKVARLRRKYRRLRFGSPRFASMRRASLVEKKGK